MKKENQEINNKKEALPKETEEIAEKVSLAEVGKEFLAPEHPELDAKEEISQYPDEVASPEVKKELQAALDRVKAIVKPTDGNIKNTKNSNVSKEQSVDYLKKNPVQINTKFKMAKETGEIVKNKDYTIEEEDKSR